jgi:hypothetical protein
VRTGAARSSALGTLAKDAADAEQAFFSRVWRKGSFAGAGPLHGFDGEFVRIDQKLLFFALVLPCHELGNEAVRIDQ